MWETLASKDKTLQLTMNECGQGCHDLIKKKMHGNTKGRGGLKMVTTTDKGGSASDKLWQLHTKVGRG